MEFHDLTLEDDINDMDEGELRATLSDFQTKHRENAETADELASKAEKFEEKAQSLEEDLEQYSGLDEDLGEQFAELVAEESTLFGKEEIQSRYSTLELVEKAEDMGVFTIPETEQEADDEDGEGPEDEFEEKPRKTPGDAGGSGGKFREQAEKDLDRMLKGSI